VLPSDLSERRCDWTQTGVTVIYDVVRNIVFSYLRNVSNFSYLFFSNLSLSFSVARTTYLHQSYNKSKKGNYIQHVVPALVIEQTRTLLM